MVNKLFYNTSGECVVEFNIWNTAHNLAFTVLYPSTLPSIVERSRIFALRALGRLYLV